MAQKVVVLKQKLNETKNFSHMQLVNGLKCMVIQDCNAVNISLSLSICVGHTNDPTGYQGLSHLLEHMLFQGSKNYPEANTLVTQCHQSGASVEALTSAELMQINCSVNTETLTAIINIITDMISAPLMQKKSMQREMAIIEQEFAAKKNDDHARLAQVANHLTNENHPSHHFTTGNQQSFDKHSPTYWHQQLLDLYEQYVHANNISLCIITPFNVEQVETRWLPAFKALPCSMTPPAKQSVARFDSKHVGIAVGIQALENTRQLLFSFAMPNILPHYKTKPLQLLTKLLNQDVSGSLINHLKSQGWITALSAGFGQHGHGYCDYDIHLILTAEGEKNIEKIHHCVFSNLVFLQNISKQVWRKNELKKEQEIAYKHNLQGNIGHLASEFSANLFLFPPCDVIGANQLISHIDEDDVWFQYLTADNMRRFHLSKHNQGDDIEPWYGTEFKVTRLASEFSPTHTPYDSDYGWQAPSRNPFIADVVDASAVTPVTNIEQRVVNNPDYSVWHICSHKQTIHNAECYIGLFGDELINTIVAKISVDVIVSIVNRRFNQDFAGAISAGLNFRAYGSLSGLSLHCNGTNHGLRVLITSMMDNIASVPITENEYRLAFTELQTKYVRQSTTKAVYQLFNSLNQLMNPLAYDAKNKHIHLSQLTFNDVNSLHRELFKKANINVLFAGHWGTEMLLTLQHQIATISHRNGRAKPFYNTFNVNHKNTGSQVKKIEKQSDYALISYIYSSSTAAHVRPCFMLAEQVFAGAFFSAMRQAAPLAYLCGNHYLPHGSYPGLVFYGQTKSQQSGELELAITNFINNLNNISNELTEDTFVALKKNLSQQLEKPAPDPSHDYKTFWTNLFLPASMHNLETNVLTQLSKITLAQFQWFIAELKDNEQHPKIILFTDN